MRTPSVAVGWVGWPSGGGRLFSVLVISGHTVKNGATQTNFGYLAALFVEYPTARQGPSTVLSRKTARTEGCAINLKTHVAMYEAGVPLVCPVFWPPGGSARLEGDCMTM